MSYKSLDDASDVPARARVVVRRVVEEIETDETIAIAELDAKERGTILGASLFPETGKKPSNKRPMRKISYGRGRTIHIDTSSQEWRDFQDGQISVSDLKAGRSEKPIMVSTEFLAERQERLKKLIAKRVAKGEKSEQVEKPRPILLY